MTGGSKLFGRKSTQALTNAPILLKEKRHALTRSYSSSCGPLWATVYGSYLEETDDVTDRNQAFAWTPHGLRRLTAERRSRQRALEFLSPGAQPSTLVGAFRQPLFAPAHHPHVAASRSRHRDRD